MSLRWALGVVYLELVLALLLLDRSRAFVVPSSSSASAAAVASSRRPRWTTTSALPLPPQQTTVSTTTKTPTVLAAAVQSGGEKKKRRRKKPPAAPAQDPVKVSQEAVEGGGDEGFDDDFDDDEVALTKKDLATISEVARFEFQTDKEISMGLLQDMEVTSSSSQSSSISGNAIPLPDIKEARKKKQMEEEIARMEQEKEEQKVRIKRTDKEAFRRLLEQQPFADADDSYFEEEKYGVVSALLGERAKPFLAIPFGPLQVGHFVGSLVIVLMAFIEYPGFPLTNLPTPLRGCFQGGLGTVYAINAILAVVVAFKAPERGQPIPLWAIKTFTVGGLAYDQFMQLPTLDEIEKANSVKGSRAVKNKKR